MGDIVDAITDILAVNLGHIGAVAPGGTDVTLGFVILAVVLFSLAFLFYNKAKGRG